MVSYIRQWKIIQELGPAAEESQKAKGENNQPVLQILQQVSKIF
jgi:hypothetical protein